MQQSRKSVSLSGELYEKISEFVSQNGGAQSALVEEKMREFLGMPPNPRRNERFKVALNRTRAAQAVAKMEAQFRPIEAQPKRVKAPIKPVQKVERVKMVPASVPVRVVHMPSIAIPPVQPRQPFMVGTKETALDIQRRLKREQILLEAEKRNSAVNASA